MREAAGVPCSECLADARSDLALEQGAFGFLSATAAGFQVATGGADPLQRSDIRQIHDLIESGCQARPGAPLLLAVTRILLGPKRR